MILYSDTQFLTKNKNLIAGYFDTTLHLTLTEEEFCV